MRGERPRNSRGVRNEEDGRWAREIKGGLPLRHAQIGDCHSDPPRSRRVLARTFVCLSCPVRQTQVSRSPQLSGYSVKALIRVEIYPGFERNGGIGFLLLCNSRVPLVAVFSFGVNVSWKCNRMIDFLVISKARIRGRPIAYQSCLAQTEYRPTSVQLPKTRLRAEGLVLTYP